MTQITDMLRLICNETSKTFLQTKILVMIILIIISSIVAGIYYNTKQPSSTNWKTVLVNEIKDLEESNIKLKKQIAEEEGKVNPIYGGLVSDNQEKIEILKYSLKNSIPYNIMTSWHLVNKSTETIFIIIIFMIVVAGNAISSEFSSGTIKFLLIRPYKRWKMLFAKYISLILISLAFLIVLFITTLLVGLVFFGTTGFSTPDLFISGGNIMERNILAYSLQLYAFEFITLVVIITFSFMISTVFKSNSLSIASTLVLMFSGTLLVGIFRDFSWSKYLLFANLDLTQFLPGNTILLNGLSLEFSIMILFAHVILFNGITYLIFTKRDVI